MFAQIALILALQSGAAHLGTIQGRAVYGSKPAPALSVRLAHDWRGVQFGIPPGPDTTTAGDGTFTFHGVDLTKDYVILVQGFTGEEALDVIQSVSDDAKRGVPMLIHVVKQLRFTAPKAGQFLSTAQVRIAWDPLPGAASYELVVQGQRSPVPLKTIKTGDAAAEVSLPPGRCTCLGLRAFDDRAIEIGRDVVREGAVFCFVVGDPETEKRMTPASGSCKARKDIVFVFAKPSAGRQEADKLNYILTRGDPVRLVGTLGGWRKVERPGDTGWVPQEDLDCDPGSPR